jgi:hypothetical protein
MHRHQRCAAPLTEADNTALPVAITHPASAEPRHFTGIYTWQYLQQLAAEQPQRWAAYLEQLHNRGLSRDADVAVVKFID